MNIGITYDTSATYGIEEENGYICDFSDIECINHIEATLKSRGHNVKKIDGIIELLSTDLEFDIILNTAEGLLFRNREALTPAVLEAKNIKYIGADAYVSVITLDKMLFSNLVKMLGILVPAFISIDISNTDNLHNLILSSRLEYPLIVKPNNGGNSGATFVCQNEEALVYYCKQIFKNLPSEKLIVQEFIKGTEITVPVFGNGNNIEIFDIIGFEEQNNENFWINSEQKVFGGVTEKAIFFHEKLDKKIKDICRKIYQEFGFVDYTRFDFRISKNDVYFLEANAFPYLGEDGAMYKSFSRKGNYCDFLTYLIEIANNRYSINSKSQR